MQYLLRLLLIMCLLVGFALPGDPLAAAAQEISSDHKRANFWYFGHYAGLDFNSSAPVAVTDGVMSTLEGCSVISDQQGNLLFYTDGVTVWNRLHQPMANGTGLWGNFTSTQSALIVPKPGSSTLFYVFTVDAQSGYFGGCACMAYSLVDLSKGGGLGEVVAKNTLLYAPTTEKLAATLHANGRDVWVVTHQWNSNAFYAYLVTQAGISEQPIISQVGQVHESVASPLDILYQSMDRANANSAGQMKVSPDGSRLALTLTWAGAIEVFDFDNRSGAVNNAISLSNIGKGGTYYGVEFSPNNCQLYVTASVAQAPQEVLFRLTLSGSKADILKSLVFAADSLMVNMLLGHLQLAPDGNIYVARNSHGLGVIEQPNGAGSIRYRSNAVDPAGRFSMLGLPNFISSYLLPPDPVLEMPNVFTPNGDNYNPRFVPIRQQRIESASLTVCNRWGQTLYQTDDLEKGWDGNGSPAGVYYWLVRYRGTNGRLLSRKGTLTLLR